MQHRKNALHEWLKKTLHHDRYTITSLAEDASFRHYFRVTTAQCSRIVMDAPPDKENLASFIQVDNALLQHGVRVPTIHAMDLTQGFLLLDDYGDLLFRKALTPENADTLYTQALSTLLHMQQCPPPAELPHFDTAFILDELSLFIDWFLNAYLQLQLTASENTLLHDTFQWIAQELTQQPTVFIHRDYHSRNLMVTDTDHPPALGVIDFQDAMHGPWTYDVVSLLKDCYIQWPRQAIQQWLHYFYQNLNNHHDWSFIEFTQAFELCGLQRHLKVLGVFCRLHLRDGKPTYLNDLPLTLQYVLDMLKTHHALLPFYQFIQQRVLPAFQDKHSC